MFGNEHNGLSSQAAALWDGHFHIPMLGFTGSLNVSVACAITVYEALRQRRAAQRYATPQLPENERIRLFERYAEQADYRKGLMTTEDV
jgi:tRNA (guanosine-2'-O-)-methyltransferase